MAPQRRPFPRLFLARTDPHRLIGERVFLRPPERGDYEVWAELRANSRDFLVPWEPAWPPDALSRPSFRARIGRYAEDWRTDQAYNFFIFTHDETLVGGIGLSNIRRGVSETGSLGYWVGEAFARQGYMTATLPLVLDFAFDRLGLHRIEAACLPTNTPSRALLARAGFQQEGYAREYLCIEGKWQDHLLFAILRGDRRPTATQRLATPRLSQSQS
ncbi:MAG: GNAT family N-acetyltransferase [Alphaproteobacteria bacterium]|nr:GNAT family N-acetyltransferase [Alphaproteobacteria bacterium]